MKVKDINGKTIKKGCQVIWHDPETDAQDLSRVWEVYDVSEDIVYIADDYSEAEVLPNEIEVVTLNSR